MFKWIINNSGQFTSGWQKGCEETKIGYDLKQSFKWTYDPMNGFFTIEKEKSEEVYHIVDLTTDELQVKRIK